jgi:hypothetical protein
MLVLSILACAGPIRMWDVLQKETAVQKGKTALRVDGGECCTAAVEGGC